MLQPGSPVAACRPELQAAVGQQGEEAEEQEAAHHPHGRGGLVLGAAENQGDFVQRVEGGAVVAGGVGVLAGDAEHVDGGGREAVQHQGAERVRHALLAVEVLPQVAGEDAVPVGAVHDVVVVLWAGAAHGPGHGGTGVSDVVHLDVHRAPETTGRERFRVLIRVRAQGTLTSMKSFLTLPEIGLKTILPHLGYMLK